MSLLDRVRPQPGNPSKSSLYTTGTFVFAREMSKKLRACGIAVETPIQASWETSLGEKKFGYSTIVHASSESVSQIMGMDKKADAPET